MLFRNTNDDTPLSVLYTKHDPNFHLLHIGLDHNQHPSATTVWTQDMLIQKEFQYIYCRALYPILIILMWGMNLTDCYKCHLIVWNLYICWDQDQRQHPQLNKTCLFASDAKTSSWNVNSDASENPPWM